MNTNGEVNATDSLLQNLKHYIITDTDIHRLEKAEYQNLPRKENEDMLIFWHRQHNFATYPRTIHSKKMAHLATSHHHP
jgi:hypothetical protein